MEQLWPILGLGISFFALIGTKEWRDSTKRDRMYERMDDIKRFMAENYVRTDIHDVITDQQNGQIAVLKKEIDEIKVKTEMIPTIVHDVHAILKKLEK